MAQRKPKVGDLAVVDGQAWTIGELPKEKPVAKLCDDDAMALRNRVAAVREPRAPALAEFAARSRAAKDELVGRAQKRELARIAIEEDDVHDEIREALDAIPRGVTMGAHRDDLIFQEASVEVIVGHDGTDFVRASFSSFWTIPGRLHPFEVLDPDEDEMVRVPQDLRIQASLATAHRAAKEA